MSDIRIATTDEEICQTQKLMSQLHPNVLQFGPEYVQLVRTLQIEVGYELATLLKSGKLICAAGFRLCRNLGWGKYLYVDDLVTDQDERSKGAGKEMLAWLVERARFEKCAEIRLDARLDRTKAHEFYLREGMEIVAYHFRMTV